MRSAPVMRATSPVVAKYVNTAKAAAARRKAAPPAVPAGELPTIVITEREGQVNDAAAAALAADPNLYQRGGVLVTVAAQAKEPGPTTVIRRPVGAPLIQELPRPLLRDRLTRRARWVRLKAGQPDAPPSPAHPPAWCVEAVHAFGHWPGVRRLDALLPYPVLLPDGQVLAADGYHPDHGILVRLPAGLRVAVPDRPSASDVRQAVDALLEPLADFPFETPAHRAALLAGLLTPLAWFLFDGNVPLFLIDKNVRGAGAGLLADVVALTLTGRRFPVMSYTNDPEEMRKKITTLAVAGERLVLLDNLVGTFGNAELDRALTADVWTDRLLGGNRNYVGPLDVTWFGTGNNVQIGADTARRICHVRMESPEERPEERTGFRHPDLRAHVLGCRGRLLSAALTILRGWDAAGRPRENLKAWGSFEGWSNVVRQAVVFAGLPDPGDTRQGLQADADASDQAMRGIVAGMRRLDPDRHGLTAAQIVQQVDDAGTGAEWAADLREAVVQLCGKLDSRLLGNKLRHYKRRNFGGWFIDRAGTSHNAVRWVVLPSSGRGHRSEPATGSLPELPTLPPVAGESGETRESDSARSGFDDEPADGGFHFGIDDPDDQQLPD